VLRFPSFTKEGKDRYLFLQKINSPFQASEAIQKESPSFLSSVVRRSERRMGQRGVGGDLKKVRTEKFRQTQKEKNHANP